MKSEGVPDRSPPKGDKPLGGMGRAGAPKEQLVEHHYRPGKELPRSAWSGKGPWPPLTVTNNL